MLQNLKIGTRLALAFALLLALIAALAAGGISGARQLTERSATLYSDRMVPMGLLAEISHDQRPADPCLVENLCSPAPAF